MLLKCLILITVCALHVSSNAQNEYGVFNLTISQFQMCKGPKQKDCASAKVSVSNQDTLNFDMQVYQNIKPSKGKIVASTNGKEFLRLQVKTPCNHLFLRPLISTILNVTEDCVVVKGHYKFSINIRAIAQQYFGGTFIFGNWTFKSIFYSENCNLSCAIIQVTLSPLGKEH